MTPIGHHGDYVLVQKKGPGPHCNRIYSVWSRWLNIVQEKRLRDFNSSDVRYLPLIHPVEWDGYHGRLVRDINDQIVPNLDL